MGPPVAEFTMNASSSAVFATNSACYDLSGAQKVPLPDGGGTFVNRYPCSYRYLWS